MKRFILIFIFLTVFYPLQAQVSLKVEPLSFRQHIKLQTPSVQLAQINLQPYLAEDDLDKDDKDIPFRFGIGRDVHYDLNNSGRWQNLNDGGRLWTLKIVSEGALSINLLYDKFKLPPGARFYVYNENRSVVQGAFTSKNNKKSGRFATAPTKGDACILEYYEPPEAIGDGLISISKVVHGYKDVFFDKSGGFGHSGSCNININCPEGDDWQNEKRAVAMVITGAGTRLCSGALINNTQEDLTQYFLTANHCLGGEGSFIFMFNYESPGCESVDGPTWQTVQGAVLRATNKESDFALLELTEQIPQSYDVYFSGWSAVDTPASSSVCIHHPSGDIKKISFDYDSTISSDYEITPILKGGYWKIASWDLGTTEGGSSGAPLFDPQRHIIGQLKGGYAACGNSDADYFGKFAVSWNYFADSSSANLKDWLDPMQQGITVLDGVDMNSITIAHTPLKDTENIGDPYTVSAQITTTRPPLRDIYVIWGYSGTTIDSIAMTESVPGRYEAQLPAGADVTISYYISARDDGPLTMRSPLDAPDSLYSFYAGRDTIAPVIDFRPISDVVLSQLPLQIEAQVTDNFAVDTVLYIFNVNGSVWDTLTMNLVEDNIYRVVFPPQNVSLSSGDSVFYQLFTRDKAQIPNSAVKPDTGEYQFVVLSGISMISGYVSLSDSSDLANIPLFLGGKTDDTTYTDSSGYYYFDELPNGEYSVRVDKDDYFTLDSLIAGIVVDSDTIHDINFQLQPLVYGSVGGFVNLEDNSDSSGVIVSIKEQGLSDTTTANGAFLFPRVYPGAISLLFEKEGYVADKIDTLLTNGDTLSGIYMTLVKNVKPRNLHIVNSLDSVQLAWDDIALQLKVSAKDDDIHKTYFKNMTLNVDYYRLYRSRDSIVFSIKADTLISLDFTDIDVQIGEKYWYFIRAFYNGHWSENSDTVMAYVESGAGYEALIYDNGTPVSGYFWTTTGSGSGSRMSPGGRVKIVSAKFYLLQPNTGENSFTAKIFDFDGVRPVAELGHVNILNAGNNKWAVADFSAQNILTDRDFIVFMEYDGDNEPVFAYDTTDNARAWDYNPYNGGWMKGMQTYLMRADVQIVTALEDAQDARLPKEYSLSQNYPNPFNPETIIRYVLPKQAQINLSIYNTLGQKVRTLVDKDQAAGCYQIKWDGRNDDGDKAASGIYILQFKSVQFSQTRKMLLIR